MNESGYWHELSEAQKQHVRDVFYAGRAMVGGECNLYYHFKNGVCDYAAQAPIR